MTKLGERTRQPSSILGGCQCGAVRYRITGALTNSHVCHCRMCQKAAGNVMLPLVNAQKHDIEFYGRRDISWFASSDPVRRGFCDLCGTPLVFESLRAPHLNVTVGSLDQPEVAAPGRQYGLESKVPWFDRLSELPGGTSEQELDLRRLEEIRRSNHQHPDHENEET